MRAALADPRLLGSALVGASWDVWRVFLIALMGERLSKAEREVFAKFTGREREPGERVEEALFLVGRRGGKDRAAAVLSTYLAALVDWSGVLSKGETGLCLCIGADQRQAKVQRDYIEGTFDASPLLSSLVTNKTADSIELSNNVAIEVRAANFRRLRGPTAIAVVASECAFWLDETSANADTEILNAVRPTLATTGGPLVLITTPYAQRGEVYNVFKRHFGPQGDPLVLVAQGTSRDFNPTLSQKVVDRALERDHAAASAEYLAVFRTDVEEFVRRDAVEACVDVGVFERPPQRGVRYVGFVDPSGGSADAMTLAVGHIDRDRVAILDCLRRAQPPFAPSDVVADFAEVLKSYRVTSIKSDRYAGEWVRESLQREGIRCEQSAKPKSDLYISLLPTINSGRCRLLDDARLVSELCSLERRTARSGKDSVDHRPGAHDDVANCVAGVLVDLVVKAAPVRFTPEMLDSIAKAQRALLGGGERRAQFVPIDEDEDENVG
jgi:hypothetical protein